MKDLILLIKNNQAKINKETLEFLQESFFLKGRTPFDTITMIPDSFLEKHVGLLNIKKDFLKAYSTVLKSKENPLDKIYNEVSISKIYNDGLSQEEVFATIDMIEEVSSLIPDRYKNFEIEIILTKNKEMKVLFDGKKSILSVVFSDNEDEMKANIFHEFGHIVENFNKNILDNSRSFLKERIFSKDKMSFDELQEEYSLRDEKRYSGFDLYAGQFIDPYVGRTYGNIEDEDFLTEVISIGFQAFYYDWKNFLIKDPVHFELIYNIINES